MKSVGDLGPLAILAVIPCCVCLNKGKIIVFNLKHCQYKTSQPAVSMLCAARDQRQDRQLAKIAKTCP
jgi:hypothetical protein